MRYIDNGYKGQLNITYFTDPLCCWSWVFEPVWQQLKKDLAPVLSYKYCMAGMIPSWDQYHDTLNSVNKPIQMGPVWLQAKNLSGTFIDDKLWFNDPPASSYPACVAVKCAALQSPALEELYLYKLREAALLHGRNIAKREILLEVAGELSGNKNGGLDLKRFGEQLTSAEAIESFRNDLSNVSNCGISRFPSLAISIEGKQGSLILTGNRPYEAVMASIQALSEKVNL